MTSDRIVELEERLREFEAELHRIRERYALATRAGRVGVWDWDLPSGRIHFDVGFRRLLGFGESEIGDDIEEWVERIHPDDRPRRHEALQRCLEEGAPVVEIEFRLLAKDESVRWIRSVGMIMRDERGRPVRITGTDTDVTERREAEEERERLQRHLTRSARIEAVGTLAGGIAHEMNNVLGITMGHSQMGALLEGLDPDAARNFQEIVKASKRGRDIVQRILRFSRHTDSDRSRIDAANSVADVLRLLRPLLPDTIRVKEDLRAAGAIEIDPTELHQVLVNLCTNAAQAMEERGGEMSIGLEAVELRHDCPRDLPPGEYVRIRVADTGPGIAPDVLSRVLDPFFTTKPVGEGTGLGLSVADGIARDHGGAIVLASEPGRGTTADVYLPRLEEAAAVEISPPAVPTRTATGRVLFVDDEPSVIRITVQMLESLGYEARGIARPTYALDVFRADPEAWDLLLTDENMPELRGHELARETRRLREDLPVLICTGHAEGVPREALEAADISAVLRKPLLLEELEDALRRALEAVPSG